jgi:hypothetical protein
MKRIENPMVRIGDPIEGRELRLERIGDRVGGRSPSGCRRKHSAAASKC